MDITNKITELINSVNNGEINTLAELQRELIYFKDEIQALRQPLVSGRSELLLAFGKFIDADCDLLGSGYIEEMVKKFEASNSH